MKPGQITPPSNPPLPPLKPSCRTPKPSSTSPSTSSASTALWKRLWPSSNSSRPSAKNGNESNSIGPSNSTARPNNKASPTTRKPMGSFFRRRKSLRNGSAANGTNPPTMPTGTKPASPEHSSYEVESSYPCSSVAEKFFLRMSKQKSKISVTASRTVTAGPNGSQESAVR